MFRWLLIIFIVLVLLASLLPALERLGLGKLPGDFRFTLFGLNIFLPFASTVLLALVISLLSRFI